MVSTLAVLAGSLSGAAGLVVLVGLYWCVSASRTPDEEGVELNVVEPGVVVRDFGYDYSSTAAPLPAADETAVPTTTVSPQFAALAAAATVETGFVPRAVAREDIGAITPY